MSVTDDALEALAAANRPAQFTVLQQVMGALAESPAVTHLAVRGSFAAGTSDRLSDVDLVVGVREDAYREFVQAHAALVSTRLCPVLPAWADTIVPNLGGLGFVHLVANGPQLYQLDLYLAPSHRIDGIVEFTRGHTMYTQPGYTPASGPHTEVEEFIAAERAAVPSCDGLVVEALVLAWLVRKRILRGQRCMAFKEAHQLVTAARSLARTALSPHTAYLGWYHLERDLGATPIGQACLKDLEALLALPAVPTSGDLAKMLDVVLEIAERAAPETLHRLGPAVAAYRHYLTLD